MPGHTTGVMGPVSAASSGGWPRGFLRPCLLLLIAESPCHGYDLLDRLERLGTPAVDAGTLYRNLRRMEREEVVSSRWEVSSTGPARRTYAITQRGAAELDGWVELLTEGKRSVDAYLRRFGALSAR
ncbi:MAG: PadR family transcriptional regulator [Chloroflexota bacterium]